MKKLQLHTEPVMGIDGFDAWITNETGEVIGDGWGMTREEAATAAKKDALLE